MFSKAFRLLLGLGLAIAILFVAYAYTSVPIGSSLQPTRSTCIPATVGDTLCFSAAKTLSHQETTAIAVSPDGQWLANSWQNTVQLWNLATGDRVRSFQEQTDWITALAFSPDGKLLASASLDGTIALWNLEAATLLGKLEAGKVTCLTFSPDSTLLASGSRIPRWPDGTTSATGVQIWDVAAQDRRFRLGDQPISALAFSLNGRLLAAGSAKTQLWEMSRKVRLRTIDSGELTALTFTQDSKTLITASSKIKLWDVDSGELVETLKSRSSFVSLSPDEQTLATVNGGTVNLWRMQTGRLLGTLRASWYSRVTAAFGLEGAAIVAGGSDGIRFWRAEVKPQSQPEEHLEPPSGGEET